VKAKFKYSSIWTICEITSLNWRHFHTVNFIFPPDLVLPKGAPQKILKQRISHSPIGLRIDQTIFSFKTTTLPR